MFVVRKVDITDPLVREAISTMIVDAFQPGELTPGSHKITSEDGHWWIAFAGKQAAAFAALKASARVERAGYMSLAGVLPAYRGHGLQRRLIKARLAYAKRVGWTEVFTDTIHDNHRSMVNLIACGFRPYMPATLWAHETAVYWKRVL